jgi:hypothetical protein
MSETRRKRLVRMAYQMSSQFVDPLRAIRALGGAPQFWRDYRTYFAMAGAEPRGQAEIFPCLHERASSHELDAHYFYVNAWAARRILANHPTRHVDVASQIVLSSLLSAMIPVAYFDYRTLNAPVDHLSAVSGDLLRLPIRDGSLRSLSCLHVAEHVGLGRYGDSLDPGGTRKATAELTRVLAPGGNLFFALPVGRERVVFNAHRVFSATTIREYFAGLTLREHSGVTDAGMYVENVALEHFDGSDYACGFFWFQRD